MPEAKHSLSDSQIQSSFKTNEQHFQEALRRAKAILDDTSEAKNSDPITVPVELIRTLARALFAMHRMMTGPIEPRAIRDSGDKGSACDYNPFGGINIGDPWDGTIVHKKE